MPMPDPATVTIAGATVLTWLLGISFLLGQYSQRQKASEKEADQLRSTIKEIFAKLDTLSAVVPHKCEQLETITNLRAESHYVKETLLEHSRRMDRIQQAGHAETDEGNGKRP